MTTALPPHLLERVCATTAAPREGAFVLYWMRVALRAHENPALDVAIEIANARDLPLLVYQGLSERYPYANDRLHTFILEAARDVGRELAERGITYALHVERPGHREDHLARLAARAALVVTEEMPTEPLRRWTDRVATHAPTYTVDASCVVPMPLTTGAPRRAFEFRKQTSDAQQARVARPWTEAGPPPRSGDIPLGFAPVDLADASRADIAELVAACDIDHTVGPVAHTEGGSRAGYARWEAFREGGLASYAKRRNDPLAPGGVSRMSPYLHFGCVSAMRLAREASGAEAAKYLDELLVWREVAWHHCFHTQDHESLMALPDWARETLRAHAADPRPTRFDWESLARAETGDALWDAAQRSLRIHGELHNNVRMTWGKAFLPWTRTPEEALARMIDLNHRFALDGRDPASYGGLLWCLGLFDRPFKPETTIRGVLRPRETTEHTKRLDVAAYSDITRRPSAEHPPSVVVIGAGIAGLTCARTLTDHGLRVTVLDKARGPGGRMSTRRRDGSAFDHGAQYFTARDATFRRYVEAWADRGVVARWDGRFARLTPGNAPAATTPDEPRYVGAPRMSRLTRHLSADLEDLRFGVRVGDISREAGRWRLRDEEGAPVGEWDCVVVATPGPQASPLLERVAPVLAARVAGATYDPCWAVMMHFEAPVLAPFDGARLDASPLAWVARDNSKPGRPAGERWVLHASPAWSEEHLEDDPAEVVVALRAAFREALGVDRLPAEPIEARAHRWRYAQVREAVGEPALLDAELGVGVCGDALLGGRVEAAWRSGAAMAGRVLGQVASGALRASDVTPSADG